MTRYRKLPVEVEAVQWQKEGDSPSVTVPYITSCLCPICQRPLKDHGYILYDGRPLHIGARVVCPGEYVFMDENGNTIAMSADEFERLYECVED